ncbi:MAG: nonstructural protein [Microvirus sp.]|nr:MAG: nonstructural protein [Microvirus sp.]
MLKIFAVRDVKAEAYGALICVMTKGLASRAFVDACSDSRSPMAQYPSDYSLYELGEFDPNSGAVSGHKLPVYIMSATEALASVPKVVTPSPEVVS